MVILFNFWGKKNGQIFIILAPKNKTYFNMEKGNINIQAENIFPIIKKFLYTDQEIFLRELVSNAVDATSKLKKLSSIGEYKGDLGDLKIEIYVNKEFKNNHNQG